MLNIIVGENASGKTVALQEKLEEVNLRDAATNLRDTSKYSHNIVDEKVRCLWRQIPFNVENVNNKVYLESTDKERDPFDYNECLPLKSIVTALCSDKKYFIWDEPEHNIPETLKDWVMTALLRVSTLFDEVWISTHLDGMDYISGANYFKVDKNGYLVRITEDEAGELLTAI